MKLELVLTDKTAMEAVAAQPYGELGLWGAAYSLAYYIDKLHKPMYGPMIEDEEEIRS